MNQIFDARNPCHVSGKNFFFDTCVWIAIYGNGLGISKKKDVVDIYSDYYSSILNSNNMVFVNEFVISEFFNRMCKMEYEIMFGSSPNQDFKSNRKKPAFIQKMDAIKETCKDIIADSKFIYGSCCDAGVDEALNAAAMGNIDFTDAVIIKTCSDNNCILVSDDRDFKGCKLDLVTANIRLLIQ